MKILSVSDIHGNFFKLEKIYLKENPGIVIFSGDGAKDFDDLKYCYENRSQFIGVKGNMDFDYNMQVEKIFEISNKKIFLTHGHLYDVKLNYLKLIEKGEALGVDIIIFGHTHKPTLEKLKSIKIFNPGSVKNGDYGIITIINNEVIFELKNL